MAAFAAGQLRHSMVLEQRKQGVGAGSALVTTFERVGDVFAAIEGVGATVYQTGMQTEERVTHRVTIRFRARTDFDHISRGSQRFKVRWPRDPDGKRRWLLLDCEEVTVGEDQG